VSESDDRDGFPEELEGLTREGLRKLTRRATEFARMFTDAQRATVIGVEVIEAIFTTRPWDPRECTLLRHVYQTTRSMCSTQHRARGRESAALDKARASDQFTEAIEAKVRTPYAALSIAETEASRQAFAERFLARLEVDLEDDPVGLATLRGEKNDLKAREIADQLGIPVGQVYRAHDRIQDRIATIRKRMKKEDES